MLLVWRDPRRTHRRVWVRREIEKGKEMVETVVEEPYPVEMRKRVSWVMTLLVSLRLTGWRNGEASHDRTQPPPRLSRLEFLKIALGTLLRGYVILDATFCYVSTDPYFVTSGIGVDTSYPIETSSTSSVLYFLRLLPPRVLRSIVLAGQIYAMVTTMFFLPTLPAIGLNSLGLLPDEWSPQTWPLFFGDFSTISELGLRGMWGSWWHKMNREITATHGRSLAQAMSISGGSTLNYALLTTSAFLFSGIIHMGMIPPEPESTNLSANMMRLYVASFFWSQIPAFGIELVVSNLVARLAPGIVGWHASKVLVLIWTAFWLCLTLPILTVPFREIGYWQYDAVPASLLHALSGKG